MQEQVAKLTYAPLFQIGHELAFEWAEALVNQRPHRELLFNVPGATDRAVHAKLVFCSPFLHCLWVV